MSEKLQKVLARAGLGSRRELEQWIVDRRVSVNGKIASLGDRVEENDKIRVDGKALSQQRLQTKRRIIAYHKPVGEVCTRSDPEGRATVFEHLPKTSGRWISVGRLDLNTSGLLLFTNDGELANTLMHPSCQVEREYIVRVLGQADADMLRNLQQGVQLEDGLARFESIRDGGGEGRNHTYHVVITEGRNREVRRLWESQELTVSRLMRVRFGPYTMPRFLRPGRWMELEGAYYDNVLKAAGMEPDREHKTFQEKRKRKQPPRTMRRDSRKAHKPK